MRIEVIARGTGKNYLLKHRYPVAVAIINASALFRESLCKIVCAHQNNLMTRTFAVLAVLTTVAMLATIGVGFWSFGLERSAFQNGIFIIHFYLGLATAIGILLIHCLIFTYFLGTGRWVKEVGLAFDLPDEPWPRLTRELKRATFPPALSVSNRARYPLSSSAVVAVD